MRFPVGLLMITRRLSTALTTTTTTRIAIIGSGASGTFTALVAAENAAKANDKVIISVYEATAFQCSKVKISGGGRCNVLHSPADFSLPLSYPRGAKELRSTFSPKQKFTPENMVEFFESRGLPLHTESDGRMFPRSNKSQSVIDLLVSNSKEAGVDFKLKEAVSSVTVLTDPENSGKFQITTATGGVEEFDKVVLATGSKRSGHAIASSLGHTIVPPVPSLFTVTLSDRLMQTLFEDCAGVSVDSAGIKFAIPNANSKKKKKKYIEQRGPLLVTHKGLSGPGILRLSSFGAVELAKVDYKTTILINLAPEKMTSFAELEGEILKQSEIENRKLVVSGIEATSHIPKRLWRKIVEWSEIEEGKRWNECSKKKLRKLAKNLWGLEVETVGKSTYKEEFTTAGGVDLREVQINRGYESKTHSNLYFVGEVLNVDAVTGGFNFMNCWSSGHACAQALVPLPSHNTRLTTS